MKTVTARSRCWALTISSQSKHLEHGIEAVRELAIVITNQKTNRLRAGAQRPRDLPRLLRYPIGVGMGRAPSQVHAAAGDFDEEQHVQSLKPDCLDGKEINRDRAGRLRAQELAPRWTPPLPRRAELFCTQ